MSVWYRFGFGLVSGLSGWLRSGCGLGSVYKFIGLGSFERARKNPARQLLGFLSGMVRGRCGDSSGRSGRMRSGFGLESGLNFGVDSVSSQSLIGRIVPECTPLQDRLNTE